MSESPVESSRDPVISPRSKDKELSGRAIVAGMFLMGLTACALLFIYFEFNTRPFRVLREAIGREFKHSRPNVEGGRPKGRGAMTLRISMSVPFNPSLNEAAAKPVLKRVLSLAKQHQDLSTFDKIEVNLIHFIPEKDAVTKTFTWSVSDAAQFESAE